MKNCLSSLWLCRWQIIVFVCCFVGILDAQAQTSVILRQNFTGAYDYTAIGGSLTSSETACTNSGSSTKYLTIPSGCVVQAAYLYWAYSSSTADNAVSFNNQSVSALSSSSMSVSLSTGSMTYRQAVANVTSLVTGSGNYTFSNLTYATSGAACSASSTLGSWALVVVYGSSSLPQNNIRLYDGFQYINPSSALNISLSSCNIPSCNSGTVMTHIVWEGDNALNDNFKVNGTSMGTNTLNSSTAPGLDIDTYTITSNIGTGTSVTIPLTYQNGSSYDNAFVGAYVVRTNTTCGTSVNCSDITAGSIGSNQTICTGGDATAITSLSNATTTFSGGVKYVWLQYVGATSPTSNTGATVVSGATGASYDPPAGSITSTTWFRRCAAPNSASCTTYNGETNWVGVTVTNCTSTCTGNMLLNPGMENGLTSWQNWGYVTAGTSPYSGVSNATICNNAAGGMGQHVIGTAGTTYTLTAYAKVSGGPNWAGIGIDYYDANWNLIGNSLSTTVSATNYTLYTVSGVAPAGTAYVTAWMWKDVYGCLYVDDFCLTSSGGGTTVNCSDITAGSIGSNQTICTGGDPAIINSITNSTTSFSGGVKYIWLRYVGSTTPSSSTTTGVTTISGATGATYDPPAGSVTATTWFRRCAAPNSASCTTYNGETNWVGVTVTNCTSTCTGNMLLNPGMENGLTSWQNWGYVTAGTSPYSGVSNATICNNAAGGMGQHVIGTAGTTYTLTAYAKVSGGPNWAGIGIDYYDANWNLIGNSLSTTVSATNYTLYTVSGVAPAGTAYVTAWMWKDVYGCLYVDDFCLTSSGGGTTVNCSDITAGSIGSSQTICAGGDPAAITSVSNASTSFSGGVKYIWLQYVGATSPTSNTGATVVSGATGATYDPPAGSVTATTWFRRCAAPNSASCTTYNAESNWVPVYTTNCTVNCSDITAGSIGSSQTICAGGDPAAITSVSNASTSFSGGVKYIWLQYVGATSPTSNTGATVVSGATGATYDPPAGSVTATTWFRRCATPNSASCTTYNGESNWVSVTVNPTPNASISGNTAICSGSSTTLTASGGGTYMWSTGANTAAITVSTAGTYTVTVTNGGCTATTSKTVTVGSVSASISGNTAICSGSSTTLTASGGGTYMWSTGANTAAITVSTAGTYTVTVTNGGCTATATKAVTVAGITSGITAPSTTCALEPVLVQAQNVDATCTYSWNFGANATPSTATGTSATIQYNVAAVGTAQTITLTVTKNGCSATFTKSINVTPQVFADAGPDKEICQGGSVQIGGNPAGQAGSTFSWSPSTYLNSSTVANPIASPPVTTTYTLTTTLNGCTRTDQVVVSVNVALNPNANAGGNKTVCSGQSVQLGGNPTSSTANVSYVWSPANSLSGAYVANPTAYPTTNTTYTVTVTNNATSCSATSSAVVTVTSCATPSLTINDITVTEGVNPTATLQICTSTTSTSPITVTYTTSNGTATSGSDYTTTTGTATIPAGQTCVNVTIPIVDDNINEPTENFTVTLTNPSGATIADGTGVVTILDNDVAPIPTISINDITVTEGTNPTATLQICASATSTSPMTVTYTTSNGTATSGSDYTTTTGTATIPAGQTCVNVTIPIIDDTTGEPTENFTVTLTNPSGATIADGTGVVTILDNDSATGPASVGNFVWNDANNNGVQDQGELGIAGVSVNLYTSAGSWAGYAQTDANGAYLFSNVTPGSYKICFNIPWGYSNASPKDQGGNDATDSDVNAISGGSACTDVFTVAAGQNIATIDAGLNNGTTTVQPTISINDITVTEGTNPTATLQICASATSTSPMTVTYTTSNGTATSGSDYTTTTSTATIPAGQTCVNVTIPIIDDATGEPTENFTVTLTNPSGATIADGTGVVTILDNDQTVDCTNITGGSIGYDQTVCVGADPVAFVSLSPATTTFGGGVKYQWFCYVGATAPSNMSLATPIAGATSATYDSPVINQVGKKWFRRCAAVNSPSCTSYFGESAWICINVTSCTTPTISINDITVTEGTNPTATLQICASATSTSPMTVTYTTSNGTATSGSDYTTTTGTATIPAGQTCVNVTIPIIDDTTGEPTENFTVTLTNPSGATIADGTGVVTILDNDSATGPASVGNFVWNDANNNGVQDQGELGIAGVSVNLYTSAGSWAGYAQTDANGAYLFSNVTPGSYKICFNIPWGYSNASPKDQGGNDATDSDVNAISGGSACTDVFTVAAGQNIATIDAGLNNGTTTVQPTISINDITVTEGTNPTATLQICASATSTSPMTVTYTTSNGTATSGSDYTTTTSTATIPAGQTCVNVTIPIIDDTTGEPTENFTVTLTNPSGATIADGTGVVTILDNDGGGGGGTCNNITDAGQIGSYQSGTSPFDPANIVETSTPTGGSGTLEYQWQSSTDNWTWTNIAGATSATYDPSSITVSTYYRRATRRSNCTEYLYTNGVMKEVTGGGGSGVNCDDIAGGGITGTQSICAGADPAPLTSTAPATTSQPSGVRYQWFRYTGATAPTDPNFAGDIVWGATSESYDPPAWQIYSRTWYRRCSGVNNSACSGMPGETPWIMIDVTCSNSGKSDMNIPDLSAIMVSPVPTATNLSVSYESGLNQEVLLQVFDVTGKVVSTTKYIATEGTNEIVLDVSGLISGYYVVMLDNGNMQQRAKFVIVK